MHVVGVDENGLGPLLGPLTSTAVRLDVADYDARLWRRRGLRLGLGDSKSVAGFGAMSHCESVALALVERATGTLPHDVDALLDLVAEGGTASLTTPCPSRTRAHCWDAPLALPAWGGDVAVGRRALDRLEKHGARVAFARTVVSCVHVLNTHHARGRNKLLVNLAAFERLVLAARATSSEDVLAICGMIGGLRFYGDRFSHFMLAALIEEARRESRYWVPRVGEVRFVVDADDGHLPVALASMLGKYVRELLVERQSRFYRGHDATLESASGYHDPVTRRFVAQSERLRKRLGIADQCFERDG